MQDAPFDNEMWNSRCLEEAHLFFNDGWHHLTSASLNYKQITI